MELVAAGAFTTGIIAYENFGALDLSDHYSVRFWIKSDTDLAAGVLELLLDDTNGAVSPVETLALPAIASADGWTRVQLKFAAASGTRAALLSVALNAASDPGTPTIDIDFVEAPGEVNQVRLVVSNALNGEPVDLTTTTDADSDGIISDEAAKSHVMSVDYLDASQRVNDVTWTKTELGKGDADNLLEPGEKMLITINLQALDPMPVGYSSFTVQLRPDTGSTLKIERTLPAAIDASMDLN